MSMANARFTLHDDEDLLGDIEHTRMRPITSTSASFSFRNALEVEQPTNGVEGAAKKGITTSANLRHARSVEASIEQDKEIVSFQGFYAPLWKTVLYYLIAVLTGGLSLLFGHWGPRISIALSLAPCALKDAQYVRVMLVDGRVDLEPISCLDTKGVLGTSAPTAGAEEDGKANLLDWESTSVFKLLEYRCNRYFYVEVLDTFVPVPGIPKDFNGQLQRAATQYVASAGSAAAAAEHSDWDVADRQMRYGANEMRVPVKSVLRLIFDEMWHPFYVFQYFSILIWVVGDAYYSYSACIFVITWFSIISTAVETHRNMQRLADIAFFATEVDVVRNGEIERLASTALVPGDVMVVVPGALPCDAVLLSGECIVDENMLTGESVPVRKVCYSPVADGLAYNPDKTTACTLYGGTMVAQARAPRNQKALAVVCRTRFYSAKGELLRSILFPREHEESFVSDSLKFIVVMLVACMGLYIWAAIALVSAGANTSRIVVRFFDMITIAVPPALPACLTIATVISINRLRKLGIFVTSPDRITVAGMLDVICFDKTGTLTEQGLDLQGVVPVTVGGMQVMVSQVDLLPPQTVALLASCHGLAHLGPALVGDPLDQKLFLATRWALIDTHAVAAEGATRPAGASPPAAAHPEQGTNGTAVAAEEEDPGAAHSTAVCPPGADPATASHAIVRRFEFSAALQRNVVVVRSPTGQVSVYVKGSPEMLRTLVQPDSIPADFDAALGEYVREGLRVLALAVGDASHVSPEEVASWTQQETEARIPLRLVGLAVMANPLRPDSAAVIEALQLAGIRTAMVTGDHLRTGISVASKCLIVPCGRPICLVDGADTRGGRTSSLSHTALPNGVPGCDDSQLQLSVLNPDHTLSPWTLGWQAAAARIMAGDMECAVTGKGFDRLLGSLDTVLLPACLHRASVFARMSPDNKRDLVQLIGNGIDGLEHSPKLGLHCGFCGDGANDCGALKAAHVGVSLCEAEASVAAPMTSRNQTIASMVMVVAEGRCTLMATYQIFQFIIGYALVQAFETNLMYSYALNIGDYQYLIEDLFFTTVLAAFMGFTGPRSKLSRKKPLSRVLSGPLVLNTLTQLLVVVVFQLLSLAALRRQKGYTRTHGTPDLRTVMSPENTTTYLVALSQFIILAIVFNKGHPHRKPLFTNWSLTASLVIQIVFVIYSTFSVDAFNQEVQELVGRGGVVDNRFRKDLFAIYIMNAASAAGAMYLAEGLIWCYSRLRSRLAVAAAAADVPRRLEGPQPSLGPPEVVPVASFTPLLAR